jgi:hypothetical protein
MPGHNSTIVRFRIQRNDFAALKAHAARCGQPVSVLLREALAASPLLASLRFTIGQQPTPVAPLFASAPANAPAVPPLVQPHRLSRQPGGVKATRREIFGRCPAFSALLLTWRWGARPRKEEHCLRPPCRPDSYTHYCERA